MDKKKCSSCGGTPHKCSCKNKEFTKAVIEIDNPEQITLMRKVVIPVSMGDDTTVPPTIGKYHNVLLYYEANSKSYLYSSDGIPTQLVNGFTNYEEAINLPQINGVTLLGDKSAADLELADAPMVITVANGNTSWSGADTAEDVYDFFLNKGKVNIVFSGGENYAYEIASAGYIENEGKLLCVVVAASTQTTGGVTDFDGNALVGTMTLYTAGKAVDVSQIELQPKLYIADFTGLDLNYNELSGVPATNASIGMVKPGDGLEVASDGTLSISDIEQYAHFFDTVADMKAATNLVAGDYARTLGYYAKDDMGGACYKISSAAPSGHYETLTSGLYAELILEDSMNVRQFGAKGDGVNNDTANIQQALDTCLNVLVPNGTYMIDAVTSLKPKSNTNLTLCENAKLQAIPNAETNYAVVLIKDVDNVSVKGGKVIGERDEHTGTTGEWGNCIEVRNSTNIKLEDLELSDGWGDGLYINSVNNIYTNNITIKKARRNGISVISAVNYLAYNTLIEDVNGTPPMAGVDFEPNNPDEPLQNIKMYNLTTRRTVMGIVFTPHRYDSSSDTIDIEITGYTDESSTTGVRLTKTTDAKGYIKFNNIRLIDNPENAIQLRNFTWSENFRLICDGVYVKRSTTITADYESSAIMVYGGQTPIGGCTLKDVEIYQPVNNAIDDMYFGSAKDIEIINPIHRTNRLRVSSATMFRIDDPMYTYSLETNFASGDVGSFDYRSRSIKAAGASSDTTVNFASGAPIGAKCTFVNMSDRTYTITIPADCYCKAFSSSLSPQIVLASGASVTLERGNDNNFIATGQTGAITVN